MGLLLKVTALATCTVWILPVAFPDRTLSASINIMEACSHSQRLVSEVPTLLSAALVGWTICYLSVQVSKTQHAHSYPSEERRRTKVQYSAEKLPVAKSFARLSPETITRTDTCARESQTEFLNDAHAENVGAGILPSNGANSNRVDEPLEESAASISATVPDVTHEAVTFSAMDNESIREQQEAPEATLAQQRRGQDAHFRGECKPCAYFSAKQDGCRQGDDCEFCHLCDLATMKRRHKEKKKRIQYMKACSRNADWVATAQAPSRISPGVRLPPGLQVGVSTQHCEFQKYARMPLQRRADPYVPTWGGPTLLTAH